MGPPSHARSRCGRRLTPDAYLRSRSSTRAVCVPSRAKRPTGGGRGGGTVVPWPAGSCRRGPRGLLGRRFILHPMFCSLIEKARSRVYHLEAQAFFTSACDVDGFYLAALDTLPHCLPGNAQ